MKWRHLVTLQVVHLKVGCHSSSYEQRPSAYREVNTLWRTLNPYMPSPLAVVHQQWVRWRRIRQDLCHPESGHRQGDRPGGRGRQGEWARPLQTIPCQNCIRPLLPSSQADVDLAVAAAKKAFHRGSAWRQMSPLQRTNLMNKWVAFPLI